MSQEHRIQPSLEAAQAQIAQLSRQLAAEQNAARQSQSRLQAQLERQQRYIAELEGQTEQLRRMISTGPIMPSREQADEGNDNPPVGRNLQRIAAENRQYRQALKVQEATYRQLFDCNPQPMWVYDLETLRFLAVNDAAVARYGYSRTEFLAMTIADIRPSEDVPRLLDNVAQVDTGLDFAGIWQHQLRDGQIIQVEVVSYALAFEGRQAELVMAQDVTQRVAAEQALYTLNLTLEQTVADRTAELRKSQAELQTILNSSPAKIYVEDLEGRYTFANQTFLNIFHSELDDILGKTPHALFPAEVADAFRANERLLLKQGGVQQFEETTPINGEERVYWSSKFLLRDEQGEVYALCGMSTDITDRKAAEQALHSSQSFLQTVLETAPVAIFWKDRQGVYQGANTKTAEIFGLTSTADIIHHTDDQLAWPADLVDIVRAEDQHIVTTGQAYLNIVQNTVLPTNREVWLEVKKVPLRDAEGRIVGILGTAHDITTRKRAELELQDLTSRLTLALQAGAYGIWDWDMVHEATWDERMYEIYGLQDLGRIATYQDWRDCVHADDIRSVEDQLQAAVQGETPFNVEFRIYRPDGKMRWIQAIAQAQRDDQGPPVRMVGINLDITDRKLAEKSLEASENRFRRVFASNIVGMMFTDFSGQVFDANDRFLHLLGYSRADLNEQAINWSKLTPPEYQEKDRQVMEILRRCGTADPWEKEYLRKDGRRVPVLVGVAMLNEYDTQCVGVVIDISDLKQAEQALQRTNQELARATRLKDEFLANMSHELRTPLNTILGMAEGLQEEVFGPITDGQRRSLTSIDRSGNHLLSLINDILDVAKIEADQFDLDFAPVSVNLLCESSLIFVKQQAQKKRLQIETRVPPRLPDLWGDERRLRQVLINLLTNAVKFTPAGGRITITAAYEGADLSPQTVTPSHDSRHPQADSFPKVGTLSLAVTDTGIGIRPEEVKKLFQPFIQIDSALNRQYTGTGLGLALVKRLTEMHGGQVELTSQVGAGSCFTLQLPVLAVACPNSPAADLGEPVEPVDSLEPATAPTILLAEDNEASINTTTAYLTAKGYSLILAKNGVEAVDLARTCPPDLILMDIQMPQLDGLGAIHQIRHIPELVHVPIVALTALAMPEDRDRCLAAGADEYVSKPIRLKQLSQLIQQLLAQTRGRATP